MPYDLPQSINTASYFTVAPKVEYNIIINGKEIKQESPAIIRYNKEKQENEFISTNFRGHLASIKIAENTKAKFPYKQLIMEFQSMSDEGVVKEMLQMAFDRPLTYSLIGKLANIDSYGNIKLTFGSYSKPDVKDAKKRPFVTLEHNGVKVECLYIADEQYRKQDHQLISPEKVYLKEDGDSYKPTTSYDEAQKDNKGIPTMSPKYVKEIFEIYSTLVNEINSKLFPLKADAPITYSNVKITDEEDYQDMPEEDIASFKNKKVDDDDLPEIDIDSLKAEMPF
jgi:hypothetical protein